MTPLGGSESATLTEPQRELLRRVRVNSAGLPLRDRSRANVALVANSLEALGLIKGVYVGRPGWMTWKATKAGLERSE